MKSSLHRTRSEKFPKLPKDSKNIQISGKWKYFAEKEKVLANHAKHDNEVEKLQKFKNFTYFYSVFFQVFIKFSELPNKPVSQYLQEKMFKLFVECSVILVDGTPQNSLSNISHSWLNNYLENSAGMGIRRKQSNFPLPKSSPDHKTEIRRIIMRIV